MTVRRVEGVKEEELTEQEMADLITDAADELVFASDYHEDHDHDGEPCPAHRIQLLAYVAHRLAVPVAALEDGAATLAMLRMLVGEAGEVEALLDTDGPLH